VKFWDASAIVSLLVEEEHSRACRDVSRADPGIVLWQFTFAETISALRRNMRRDPPLSEWQFDAAHRRLNLLRRHWEVVKAKDDNAIEDMNGRELALMIRRPIQSGDALQLAAAMTYFEPVHKAGFVVIDRGLAHAAKAEGFTIYPPRPSRRIRKS
jgi:predicted nucleic acid-binding protein